MVKKPSVVADLFIQARFFIIRGVGRFAKIVKSGAHVQNMSVGVAESQIYSPARVVYRRAVNIIRRFAHKKARFKVQFFFPKAGLAFGNDTPEFVPERLLDRDRSPGVQNDKTVSFRKQALRFYKHICNTLSGICLVCRTRKQSGIVYREDLKAEILKVDKFFTASENVVFSDVRETSFRNRGIFKHGASFRPSGRGIGRITIDYNIFLRKNQGNRHSLSYLTDYADIVSVVPIPKMPRFRPDHFLNGRIRRTRRGSPASDRLSGSCSRGGYNRSSHPPSGASRFPEE